MTRNEHQGQEDFTHSHLGLTPAHCTMTQWSLWTEGWLQFRNSPFSELILVPAVVQVRSKEGSASPEGEMWKGTASR